MKNQLRFTLWAAFIACSASGQTNTYPFPASGNVGLGTTSPSEKLTVIGNVITEGVLTSSVATNEGGRLRLVNPNKSGAVTNDWTIFNMTGPYNNGLAFWRYYANGTNAGPSVFFHDNGNVGIGTVIPGEKLSIGDANEATNLKIGRWAFLGQESSHLTTVFGGNAKVSGPSTIVAETTVDGYRAIRLRYDQGITFHTYQGSVTAGDVVGHERMRITTSGNVGLGTPHPRSRLDIGSSLGAGLGARFGDYFEINEREAVNNAVSLGWNASISANNGTYVPTYAAPGASSMVLAMESGGYANLDFWGKQWNGNGDPVSLGSFTHVMRLGTNGNVGIGTTNPQHKLAVNGTIKAKEIIVETSGWSDYVFADDYRLAPLAEVEAHIKTNKHLPGIPSAAQVAERGINVGNVQAALLAKLEEVTLHLIAQEKTIAALQSRVQELERR